LGGIYLALIRCPECNREISDRSKACIGCGYPFANWSLKVQ